ncbi:MAG: cytochrome c [Betaproteobacteria bacterium]|nr:cytochrome c [Betaproteobacteria bacterium]
MTRFDFALIALWLALLAATPSVRAADVNNGRQVYNLHCAGCHGPTGLSVMPNAPNLAGGGALLRPDAAILASIRGGRNAMPAYAGILKDAEILDVIVYMRTLRR